MRAQEKLVTNLHYENATSEADDDGFCFPRTTTAQLQDALEALLWNAGEVEEEVEEEVISLDWEELGEWEETIDVRGYFVYGEFSMLLKDKRRARMKQRELFVILIPSHIS